jgi:polysaccharide pyruvyl transferase WcaK-like protein
VAPSLAPHDPAATTLTGLLRERLPAGWSLVPPVQGKLAARAARRVDAVAFVGGQPFAGRTASTSLALSLVARARRVRLALVGVGIGHGLDRFRLGVARQMTRGADLLVLRDEESARILVEAGLPAPLRVGSDPAWAALAEHVRDAGAEDADGAGERSSSRSTGTARWTGSTAAFACLPPTVSRSRCNRGRRRSDRPRREGARC